MENKTYSLNGLHQFRRILLGCIGLLVIALSIINWSNGRASQTTNGEENIFSTTQSSAQGYSSGQAPFLVLKPYAETYNAVLDVNSFFDHKLPILWKEANELEGIDDSAQDTDRKYLINFLNWTIDSAPPDSNEIIIGANSYSGHNGIDYRLQYKDVIAPADGIILVGNEAKRKVGDDENGNPIYIPNTCQVWIEHDASIQPDDSADFSTNYFHLSSIGNASLEARNRPGRPSDNLHWIQGDPIRAGEVIGKSGNDRCGGSSTSAHLHFELAKASSLKQIFDPFGWWSNDPDPWTNTDLDQKLGENRTTRSVWAWAAPSNNGTWENGVLAQTDDTDASFQRFGNANRRSDGKGLSSNGWNKVENKNGTVTIGSGAWRSPSIDADPDEKTKNWAIWGLHVPADGTYRIQAYIPKSPPGIPAADNATYTVYLPTGETFTIWSSDPFDQRRDNAWADITNGGNGVFNLEANTVVLVVLSDLTGQLGEWVFFDAIRLKSEGEVIFPDPTRARNVGFVIDNSSSMQAIGKIGAVKLALPPWIDQLASEGLVVDYALEAFADNNRPVQVTKDPEQMKTWINELNANDNGVENYDCPEMSLDGINLLAPFVTGGDLLLFTDDLPKGWEYKTGYTYVQLVTNLVSMHSIILPKTCNFGSGNDPEGWGAYRYLSLSTGGTYQVVPTDKTDEALEIVLKEMRSETHLSFNTNSLLQGQISTSTSAMHSIEVDSTVDDLNVLLNVIDGSYTLTLYRPDNSVVQPSDPGVTFIDSGSAKYYQIMNPVPGNWQAQVIGSGEYRFSASAESPVQLAYTGDTQGSPGQIMRLSARLDGPVDAASFRLERLDGIFEAEVDLRDDGSGGDLKANDGLYTGWYSPSSVTNLRLMASGITNTGESFSRVDPRMIRVLPLKVEAPTAIQELNGVWVNLIFKVYNLDSTSRTVQFNAASELDWEVLGPPNFLDLDPNSSQDVELSVLIPDDVVENTVNKIWVTATDTMDNTIITQDNAVVSSAISPASLPKIYLPIAIKP